MSSLLIAVAMQVMACAIPAFHDYYLFSVYSRDLSTHFEERSNQNWAAYTNGEVTKFDYEALLGYAQRKGDKQMVNYVRLLNEYANGICEQLSDPWDYPTKEQMVKYKARLRAIKASAQTALRSRLRSQNALLVMRCNMILGLHQENIGFWSEWQQKLPNSVYRDMMRNIYAGALCHTGQQDKACEIFAEQGDMTSIRYCMYNNLSYEGIKKVYDQNINSPALPWLVQNYVNDAQTTLSEADNPYDPQPLVDSYRKGVNSFIKLANEAATKSRQPALWKAAAAWMEYMFGSRQKAQKYIDEAVKMEGTQRMKDNARAIRFYISSANARPGKAFDDYVAGELKWLRQKSKEDNPTQETWNYHYNEVAERTIFEVLADKYDQWQRPEIGIALFGYVDSHFGDVVGSQPDYEWNPHYSDYTFVRLDQKGPQAVERYLTFTKKKTDNELEQYLLRFIYRNEDYLNDLIGTKYISRMEWNKALDYLKKVPLTFLDGQNICEYMAKRSFTTEQWRKSQLKEMSDMPKRTHLTSNKKIDFVNEMNALEHKMSVADKETCLQLAYDYAVRLFQASYMGDCWFLTHYGKSVCDSARVGERDFVSLAYDYLERAAQSNNFLLKEKALYAMGYIPTDLWYDEEWDETEFKYYKKVRPQSKQYRDLSKLLSLYESHPMSDYVSKCDVLKEFRGNR